MKLLRWGVGGFVFLVSQFAQWVCLLMLFMCGCIIVTKVFAGDWHTVLVSFWAALGWALGALVAGIILHLSAYILPD